MSSIGDEFLRSKWGFVFHALVITKREARLFFVLLFIPATLLISACRQDSSSREENAKELDYKFINWARYEGEPGATSFSAHNQINKSNIDQLELAWFHETEGATASNPVIAGSIMYVLGEDDSILALDAETGQKLWSHTAENVSGRVRTRGLMYWESADGSASRVFYQKGSYYTIALNGATGEMVESFGESGVLDLRLGLGIDPGLVGRATSPTPGVVYEDLLIFGSAPGEGYFAAPGHIRAFNALTGEQEWIFHTLPERREVGYDTWPADRSDKIIEGQAFGGANAWGGLSVDAERGIVYVPVGSANYDFYGVDRHGENLFSDSLVALDARNGERLWHFQTVHHDLWDYDLAATPVLLTVVHNGEPLDIVAQATKTGLVFVFDRETGEPLWPIEERPVPASTMPGEQAWPTQPFPTWPKPFVPTEFDVDEDLSPYLSDDERQSIVELINGMAYEGLFTPVSTQPTLEIPGNRGGANWGSTAGDPRDGTFYVLAYNMPSVLQLHQVVSGNTGTGGSPIDQGLSIYQVNCQICHGENREGAPASGIPSLVGATDRLSHDEFEQIIRSGSGLMPAYPDWEEGEFDSLQMYLANPGLVAAVSEGEEGDEASDEQSGQIRYQSGWNHVLDSHGVPVIEPPWFRLTAYNLNDGSIKWQMPVGDTPAHLAAQGITGTGAAMWVRGGPAITGGDLIFQGAGQKLFAYDRENGEQVWSVELTGNVEGIPAVYAVNGRQFVVVAVTGGYFNQEPTGESTPGYAAFALPEAAE